ncbi:MAG TPA: helicase-related protein, partial [Candidatus Cybelea sp.]|nr:helicase-related protein [Candidatus Cybelea sp.]
MLAHSSGLIGLPLRLLAREVYNKCVERVGSDAVALITGEEKIKPTNARFWVATVEAMPRDLDVAFLAVDEIQLAADLERGHVFTDRILNRRGREETLILGAATMRPMVDKLLPGANVLSRPRLSTLSFAGDKKITRLPRRSAIVAFSTEEVYAIAELIRRQRGGAAVVLGALSPRTRNAQVALYQSGDVDYLVATDAIGMGLNLDVDHVAFASDRKFDGYQYRKLNPIEFAQIAGRAGRATRDGTFGSTGRCPPFEHELVQALEAHAFDSVRVLQWRSNDLDFSSIGALTASLTTTPTLAGLTRAPVAEDIVVLEHASRDEGIRAIATTRAAIERLWEVCQVPDYRKISPAAHAELVTTLYGFLMRDGKIPDDWFSLQIAQADRTDGGIDTLSTRIAHIRTWTFAANRPDWLGDPEHWQGVARGVEDKLSDALHERLAERFVDRRTSVLMRRLKENAMLETEISKTGDVIVEGHVIGRLEGFRFAPDASAGGSEAKALSGAAQKALAGEIEARATRLAHAPDSQFVLASDGTIRWIGDAVAKLTAGDNLLRPRVRILADEQLTGAAHEAVQTRLDLWAHT